MTEVSVAPLIVVFTDLDGTLLDHDTYGWEEALPALDLCKRLFIPIVLVSSKTRAEMDQLRLKLSINAPFISENGGGIFFPGDTTEDLSPDAILDGDLWKWSLGLPYADLIRELDGIRDQLGWDIKGFSDMRIDDISDLTGLDRESARLAAMREFDEPFIILDQDPVDRESLKKAAAQRGLTITEGGRFFHLSGENDKGQAMQKLMSLYKQFYGKIVSVALGDSPNDFSMLECADYPVLVRSKRNFEGLKKRIPRLMVTSEMGPKGWNTALLDILKEK
ncbi:MAG: HAD-IIB family hydrolase [Deltaproteobacteria bacterium]|nr:HAD-IIB family hydrolase [Deltaproteobacteria bacterium]MBW2118024.1 HAD-IIB family hydrolase [Deltaproteobacteria bacterium]MBW2345680.1 HAD-IIB family hydrolase [Deltaproteobacteria bacterium]